MDLDNLIERLMGNGDKYDFNVIPARYKDKVFNEVMDWYKTQNISNEIIECKRKIAELEAKVYAYEKIIANSNFAPILPKRVDYPITCNEKGELWTENTNYQKYYTNY